LIFFRMSHPELYHGGDVEFIPYAGRFDVATGRRQIPNVVAGIERAGHSPVFI